MINSTLYKFTKIIPKREYLVVSNERWDNKFLGIFEIELNGSTLFFEVDEDASGCLQYIPQDIMPLLDNDLNSIGVKYVLFVLPTTSENDRRINLNSIKGTDKYISYIRDSNLSKLL